ncbi:bifunctional diaminohydroxyphosphoribosylaminopyrimidine deaminase/5-amino-6-(5-phosphoribosylamino)uracil reductase RibD [Kiritimatiella glycovorans]|uniref:Riboflavin biosynthesis protein RibD n=1 Tax=Kiritimatiella glycovorans TaxID=1307763 RepID=A0A0G3EHW5_9BACT|nr:bifunctional diaminohydroxyphosphoribosylaminopyrimidine deaminase/5-amino-6-(5-phosphoribosylamino)uracil reductase RibD [Kiritimatiella glycovorans]AKJ65017.1 Riboflavin biosynthesis protein RibD [Kiritimatiella glycovorans]
MKDGRAMERALELARKGEGLTRPNPPVGAVLVRGGEEIAAGYHRRAGGPHAEAACLASAPRLTPAQWSQSTLYVTLEPCSTEGRTPPCTRAILEHGVGRVVVGTEDPNPSHAGEGLRELRAGGVDVECGVLRDEAEALIAPFAKWIVSGRPRVTLKLAMTADGRIADRDGRSRWISGPEARTCVQALRRRADAIMVGSGTVAHDDPSLLPRPAEGREPYRVILDADGRLHPGARVFQDEASARTLVFTPEGAPRGELPVEPIEVPETNGGCDPGAVLDTLGERGLLHVLCEGGGEIAAALAGAQLVDEYIFFMAPRILGGDARPAFAPMGLGLADARALKYEEICRVGEDLMIRAAKGHGDNRREWPQTGTEFTEEGGRKEAQNKGGRHVHGNH